MPAPPEQSIAIQLGDAQIEVRPIFGAGGLVGTYREKTEECPETQLSARPGRNCDRAPYRLIISPGSEGRWTHALVPLPPAAGVEHFELWHSRLGQAASDSSGKQVIDEGDPGRRIVRAIRTRDRDFVAKSVWQDAPSSWPGHFNDPFRMSLDAADRHMLVRQTAETIAGVSHSIEPNPLAAGALGSRLSEHG